MNLPRAQTHPIRFLFIASVLSVTIYLAYSSYYFRIGFPLDDAWIHQTYARNLVVSGEWIYTANTGSGGSTSPLWTAMLAVGYLVAVPPKLWAYLLGALTLIGTVLAGVKWFERSTGGKGFPRLELSLLIAFEWHLVWAATSGMETLLLGLLAVLVFFVLHNRQRGYVPAGLLVGLGMWIRPDAVLLLLPALWVSTFQPSDRTTFKTQLLGVIQLLAAVAVMLIPYLVFNYRTAGTIWPTTFFAKQAEYQVLLGIPFFERLLSMLKAPLVGVGVLLLPGFFFHLWDLLHKNRLASIAPFIWVGCYIGAYTLRLPVVYQHGRYLMPILPTSIVLGYLGFQKLLSKSSAAPITRIVLRAWHLALYAVLITFWALGARAYAQDVAIIESEMVDTARWLRANTLSGAKIAAHDIGAFGYFADRDLLDLAGLVSPEVIPIIRDEQALEALMNQENVDYLMTFPGWYPYLTQVGEQIYRSDAHFSPQQGGENMAVYRWP